MTENRFSIQEGHPGHQELLARGLELAETAGLPLTVCTDYLLGEFHPEWAFNLDGGPSTALLRRRYGKTGHHLVYGARQKIVDIMGFAELSENE